ncbi:MAG: DUF4147 domain-containing protein [Desulfovibrio sp.]|nr:DUF4147 domain-containing protein [Desulfovibrio sp.]
MAEESGTTGTSSPLQASFIRNREELVHGVQADLRGRLLDILEAGLERAAPGSGTRRAVLRDGRVLTIGGRAYDLGAYARVLVLGAGKGSLPIAGALEDILGDFLGAGLVVVKKGETRRLGRIRVLEGGHPLPDASSVRAGKALLALARGCAETDLVLAPVTGGSTSLAVIPQPGLSLADLRRTYDLLLKSGADIREMNIVRRHLCRLKGGRLVLAAHPAEVVTLSLDTALPGMPWPDMCLPDPSTFDDAAALLRHFHIWEQTPPAVRRFLAQARNAPELETVKSFSGVKARLVMVGDPASMCRAAAEKAAALGYSPMVLASRMHGEARETGICLAGIANEVMARNSPLPPPCALICSGESPVTIAGQAGTGGPNQELAISFAARANTDGNWACASIDTDGTDGPTDVAGGLVDSGVSARASALGLSFRRILARHDAGSALESLGGRIRTGHTGTNLQHLRIILIDPPGGRGDAA